MGILTFVRRHAVRLNPARYVLAEETQSGELKPAKFEITYRERTLPVTFPVKFKDGSDGWYTGRVHEIVENDKVGIFALSEEEETTGFVYDPNNEEHLGTPCSTDDVSKNCVGIEMNYKKVQYDTVNTDEDIKAVVTQIEFANH